MKMVYAHGKLRVVIIFEVNLLPNLSGREMSNEQELNKKKTHTNGRIDSRFNYFAGIYLGLADSEAGNGASLTVFLN